MGLRVKREVPQESLAQRLRDAREAIDWSQQEVAERVGVSMRTIQYWEAGKAEPRKPAHRRALREFIAFVECEEAA